LTGVIFRGTLLVVALGLSYFTSPLIVPKMQRYLQITQITVSVLLIIAILLQNRGAGLGGIFGGEGNVYRTKRGFERVLFWATISFSVAFFGLAVASLVF
jgi:preprotein translocase subunit SecG